MAKEAEDATQAATHSKRIADSKASQLQKKAEAEVAAAEEKAETQKRKAADELAAAKQVSDAALASIAASRAAAECATMGGGMQIAQVKGKELVWLNPAEMARLGDMIEDHKKHVLHNVEDRSRMLECDVIPSMKTSFGAMENQLKQILTQQSADNEVVNGNHASLFSKVLKLQEDADANAADDAAARKEMGQVSEYMTRCNKQIDGLKDRCRRVKLELDENKAEISEKLAAFEEKLSEDRSGTSKVAEQALEERFKALKNDISSAEMIAEEKVLHLKTDTEVKIATVKKQLEEHTHGIDPKLVALFSKLATECVKVVDGHELAQGNLEDKLKKIKRAEGSDKATLACINWMKPSGPPGAPENIAAKSAKVLEIANAARAAQVADTNSRMAIRTVAAAVEAYQEHVVSSAKDKTLLAGVNDKSLLNDLVVAGHTLRNQSTRCLNLPAGAWSLWHLVL